MGGANIFSQRTRRLVIATGTVSAIALPPVLFFVYPAILIVGGVIQPRFRMVGRTLCLIGAAALWAVFITYDAHVILPDPSGTPAYMMLSFLASEVLLAWCSVELILEAVSAIRCWRLRRINDQSS
jgi:hypothetical protein